MTTNAIDSFVSLETKRLVRAAVIAKMLDVCASSVYRSARRGVLPCVKLGRTIRFDLEEVMAALEKVGIAAVESKGH